MRASCESPFIFPVVAEPALVADEIAVDLGVVAWAESGRCGRLVFFPVVVDDDIAALAAAMADARAFLEEPHPLFETEIAAGHGPDRAEIDDIEGVAVVEGPAGKDIDPRLGHCG
jgi:hypothetical protein